MERRDVLKILSAAPFLGLRTVPQTSPGGGPASHPWRVFEDAFLSEIAFPLGGIGTGTVSLGGRGELRDWEIANKPDKGRMLDNSFFALWFREEGSAPRTMILESELRPPYRGAFGIPRGGLPGMPRFHQGRFLGLVPFRSGRARGPVGAAPSHPRSLQPVHSGKRRRLRSSRRPLLLASPERRALPRRSDGAGIARERRLLEGDGTHAESVRRRGRPPRRPHDERKAPAGASEPRHPRSRDAPSRDHLHRALGPRRVVRRPESLLGGFFSRRPARALSPPPIRVRRTGTTSARSARSFRSSPEKRRSRRFSSPGTFPTGRTTG